MKILEDFVEVRIGTHWPKRDKIGKDSLALALFHAPAIKSVGKQQQSLRCHPLLVHLVALYLLSP